MLYPEGTKVLIKPDTVEEMTEGGLYIPEIARESQRIAMTRGTIEAIGPLAEIRFPEDGDLDGITKRAGKRGDRVLFAKYGGSSYRRGGVEYRLIQDQDVLMYDDGCETEMPDTRKSMVK